MEKETIYKISLSKYYEQFQTGNGEIDAPEITEQLQNEINECIKDATVVAINGVNMSRLDHQPIVASIEEDSFGDWLFGINFKLGASADGLYIIDIRTAWWIEINVRDEGRLAIIKVHGVKEKAQAYLDEKHRQESDGQ